jgi:glutamate/tyrosine decarboxylase-like PLP-dependent enzyme
MPTTPDRGELAAVLQFAAREAAAYVDSVDERRVRTPDVEKALAHFGGPLPERGSGALAALEELWREGLDATIATSGPRCFHFVIGGTTPAALGADMLATVIDQPAYAWVISPLGVHLERLALRWLAELFGLPSEWSGIFTTGATMANYVGLGAARAWWAERHGVDVAEHGLAGLPRVPVLTSGFVHASSRKVLAMLGIGRGSLAVYARDAAGRVDLPALERGLQALDGEPAIIIANAGEVNAGEFDPIDAMADLADRYGAWLHVDGAFGLFARLSPRTAALAAGVERADSVTVDGHKWLNVPFDCGFAFVRDVKLLAKTFAYAAAYLPAADDPRPQFGNLGPESSRRSRALAVWASLRAYGREGYRAIVEHDLDIAQALAQRVDAAPDLERLADVPLSIVCFRYRPQGVDDEAVLDRLNTRLGAAILEDGRVYFGTTLHAGRVAFRPAFVSWRTRVEDIDLLVKVVRELGTRISAGAR